MSLFTRNNKEKLLVTLHVTVDTVFLEAAAIQWLDILCCFDHTDSLYMTAMNHSCYCTDSLYMVILNYCT